MLRPIASARLMLRNNDSDAHQSARFYRYAFSVPEHCGQLTLAMDVDTRYSAQIPLILFDSCGSMRLMRAANATVGPHHTEYSITPAHGDQGCIPGFLPAGEWKLLLYKRRVTEDIVADITISWRKDAEMPPETQEENASIRGLREHPFPLPCRMTVPAGTAASCIPIRRRARGTHPWRKWLKRPENCIWIFWP